MVFFSFISSNLESCPFCGFQCQSLANGTDLLDTIIACAMAVIAVANIILTVYIFSRGRKDSSEGAKKQRRFELMQMLILDNRLHLLYEFYDDVSGECRKLLTSSDEQTKVAVNLAINALMNRFRKDFLMPFKVIDQDLFAGLKETAVQLIDSITEAIFDEGINLNHEPKFNEVISEPLSLNRNILLAKLYGMASLDDER